MRFTKVILLTLIPFLFSCTDTIEPTFNGEAFVNGLLINDSEIVYKELEKLTIDLRPKSDIHESNLEILIDRIEKQTQGLTIINSCYACIFTFPPKSHIEFEIDSLGNPVIRSLFIITSDDEILGQG